MNFTRWQIDKLIRGLWRYRIFYSENGALLPWRLVHSRLLHSEVTQHLFPIDGSEPEFRAEALRRFAERRHTLQADKLKDVFEFLVEDGQIARDTFGDDDRLLQEAGMAHDALASKSDEATEELSALAQTYRAERLRSDGRNAFVEMGFSDIGLETLRTVEERSWVEAATGNTAQGHLVRIRPASMVRHGYAFVASSPPTLHVFLRSGLRDELVHYVASDPWSLKDDEVPLVRFGVSSPDLCSSPEDAAGGLSIFAFSPVESPESEAFAEREIESKFA